MAFHMYKKVPSGSVPHALTSPLHLVYRDLMALPAKKKIAEMNNITYTCSYFIISAMKLGQ